MFQSELKRQKITSKRNWQTNLDELNQNIQYNFYETAPIEAEIEQINDHNLNEQAMFFKNYSILRDCKITKMYFIKTRNKFPK